MLLFPLKGLVLLTAKETLILYGGQQGNEKGVRAWEKQMLTCWGGQVTLEKQ